jgi:GPH family glycoside/pentoside/hexuronide:cation symporter
MLKKLPFYYYPINTFPAVMLSVLGMTYYVYIPKIYADEVGVNLTLLGVVILLSRVWDGLIDPVIGTYSDRTHSKWGRRKPWIAVGSIFLCVAFYFLLNPSSSLNGTQHIIWFAVLSFLFFVCWTAVTVPYEALGVELTFDYDQRTRLLGIRESGILMGTFLASVIPFVAVSIMGNDQQMSSILSSLSIWYCLVLLVSCFLVVWLLTPNTHIHSTQKHVVNWKMLFQNKPFRLLLIAFALTSFGQYLSASLILFYTGHVLGSANGSQFLALYLGVTFLFIPLWLHLAKYFEKRMVWIASMVSTGIPFLFVLFLGNGDGYWYGLLISASAICSGGMLTLPVSMQADVIDIDEYETGMRREGLFIGVWALFRKLSAAVGTGLAFPVLDWFGYVSNGEQPQSALNVLSVLYAGVPCLCYLGACGFIWFYPVDRRYHRFIRSVIDDRNATPKEMTT